MAILNENIIKEYYRGDANATLYTPAYQHYGVGEVPLVPRLIDEGRCLWCGKQIFNKEFCSDECEKTYKDILPKRVTLKQSIKYRDAFRCRECSCSVAERNEHGIPIPVTKGGEIHHLVYVRDGGTTQPSNLVLLCHRCHSRHHKKEDEELELAKRFYSPAEVRLLQPLFGRSGLYQVLAGALAQADTMFRILTELYYFSEIKELHFSIDRPFDNIYQSYAGVFFVCHLIDFPVFFAEMFSKEEVCRILLTIAFGYAPVLNSIWEIESLEDVRRFAEKIETLNMELATWLCRDVIHKDKPTLDRYKTFLKEKVDGGFGRGESGYVAKQIIDFARFALRLLQKGSIKMCNKNRGGRVMTFSIKKKSKVKPMNGNKHL